MYANKSILVLMAILHGGELPAETEINSNQQSVACGPNSVILFLELCGTDSTDYSPREIVCGPQGASMLQIKDCCRNHGEPVVVRRFRSSDAGNLPLPAICQTRASPSNHFVVAYGHSKEYLHALDGTTGRKMRIRLNRVDDYLTGYAIVREQSVLTKSIGLFGKIANSGWSTAGLFLALISLRFVPLRFVSKPKSQAS